MRISRRSTVVFSALLTALSSAAYFSSAASAQALSAGGVSQPAQPTSAAVPAPRPEFSPYSGYVLGPGDRLSLNFFNVPEYNGERSIAVDGTLVLPLIGKLPVAGLTVEGASQAISNAYASYLVTPLVTVDVLSPRPLQIGISGEVNKPGAYEVPLGGSEGSPVVEWPTVIEALRLAGGITNQADIRSVEIQRMSPSGSPQTVRLDLWEVLQTGNVRNDITLRSGDAISVPTATALSPEELTQLSAANFSPDSIQVTVVGEVTSPGAQEIEPNAPLNQALLAAGGFDPRRANTETVELIRLNPDGTVSQREISVAFDQGINETSNPSLRNNDVVVVGRSAGAAFGDTANTLLRPVSTILSPIGALLNLLGID